jgi:hypothetical protein
VSNLRTWAGVLLPTRALPWAIPYKLKMPLTNFEYATCCPGRVRVSSSLRSMFKRVKRDPRAKKRATQDLPDLRAIARPSSRTNARSNSIRR